PYRSRVQFSRTSIRFQSVTREDSGRYICEVVGDGGAIARSEVNLIVQGEDTLSPSLSPSPVTIPVPIPVTCPHPCPHPCHLSPFLSPSLFLTLSRAISLSPISSPVPIPCPPSPSLVPCPHPL
ncbi:JAM1 protein, partial [Certhia brachydactyla]|nr:JAM1 protein [Certhia brachydactyla]